MTGRRTKILAVLCMAVASALAPGAAFASAPEEAAEKKLVGSISSIRQRVEKDHRVRLVEDKHKGKSRIHCYLVTANQTLPYVISLGWLRTTDSVLKSTEPKKKKHHLIPRVKLHLPGRTKANEPDDINLKSKNLLESARQSAPPLNVVDENNFIIPSLTESPLDSSRKVDILYLTAFDALIEKKMDKAEKLLASVLDQCPEDAKFQNSYAVVLALRGDYKEAGKHIDKAIALNGSYSFAITNRALLELARGRSKEALKAADQALALKPDFLPAKLAKARALLDTGQKEEALTMARELKQLYSADWQTMLLLADAELATKNYKEARETLARLTVLSPNNSDLLLKLAHAEEQLGDLDAAMKNARKSTQAGAQDPRTHIALGDYLKDNRDEKAALLQYERALDLKPASAFKKRAMGSILSIYVGQNKLEEAYEISGQWVDKNQDEAFCHFNHAWIASQLDGTEYRDTAIEEYKTAIELDKSLASARYNLALLLLKGGRNEEALAQLKTFVKDSPDDKDVPQAKELLEKLTGAGTSTEKAKKTESKP